MLRVQLEFQDHSAPDTMVEMEHLPRVGDEVLWLVTATDPAGRAWEHDTGWVVRSVMWLMGPDHDAVRGPDVSLHLESDGV